MGRTKLSSDSPLSFAKSQDQGIPQAELFLRLAGSYISGSVGISISKYPPAIFWNKGPKKAHVYFPSKLMQLVVLTSL